VVTELSGNDVALPLSADSKVDKMTRKIWKEWEEEEE